MATIDPSLAQAIVNPLVPDIVGQFREGQEQRRGRDIRSLTGQVLAGEGGMSELQKLSPEVAMKLSEHFRSRDAASLDQTIRDSRILQSMIESGDFRGADRFLAQRSAEKQMRGEDVEQTEKLRFLLQQDPTGSAVLEQIVPFNKAIDAEQGRTLEQDKLAFEREKYGIAVERAKAEAGEKKGEAKTKIAIQLRKNYRDLTKDFRAVESAYGRVKATGKAGTPAGDLAMIFSFMKMVDPGSVVRESEFKTAADAKAWLVRKEAESRPVPAPIANAIRKAKTGNILEDPQRLDFLARAKELFDSEQGIADKRVGQVLDIADVEDVRHERILGRTESGKYKSRKRARAKEAEVAAPVDAESLTDAEIDQLAKQHGITREEVIERLEQSDG